MERTIPEITAFLVHKLRYSGRLQFHTEYRDLFGTFERIKTKVQPLFDTYCATFAKTEEAFKRIDKSAVTEQIDQTDTDRDRTISGIREITAANIKHFDEAIKNAAKRVKVVFDSYKDIAKKPLNEETAEITNLLQELQAKYTEDTVLLGINTWLEHLESLNKKFASLIKERDDEKASQSPVVLKDALNALDEQYHKLNKRISAFAEIEEAPDCEEFIVRLNVLIARYDKK